MAFDTTTGSSAKKVSDVRSCDLQVCHQSGLGSDPGMVIYTFLCQVQLHRSFSHYVTSYMHTSVDGSLSNRSDSSALIRNCAH